MLILFHLIETGHCKGTLQMIFFLRLCPRIALAVCGGALEFVAVVVITWRA